MHIYYYCFFFFFQKRNAKQLQCSNCSLVICGFALVFALDFILVFRTSLQFTDSNLPTGKLKDRITINTGCCLGMLIIGYIRHWQTSGQPNLQINNKKVGKTVFVV